MQCQSSVRAAFRERLHAGPPSGEERESNVSNKKRAAIAARFLRFRRSLERFANGAQEGLKISADEH